MNICFPWFQNTAPSQGVCLPPSSKNTGTDVNTQAAALQALRNSAPEGDSFTSRELQEPSPGQQPPSGEPSNPMSIPWKTIPGVFINSNGEPLKGNPFAFLKHMEKNDWMKRRSGLEIDQGAMSPASTSSAGSMSPASTSPLNMSPASTSSAGSMSSASTSSASISSASISSASISSASISSSIDSEYWFLKDQLNAR